MEATNLSTNTIKFLGMIESEVDSDIYNNLKDALIRMSNIYYLDLQLIESPSFVAPLRPNQRLYITIRKKDSTVFNFSQELNILTLPNDIVLLTTKLLNFYIENQRASVSKDIYNKTDISLTTMLTKEDWNTIMPKPFCAPIDTDAIAFIRNVMLEVKARGDFEISIPRFVDLLFRLDVIIAKEDIQNPNKEE